MAKKDTKKADEKPAAATAAEATAAPETAAEGQTVEALAAGAGDDAATEEVDETGEVGETETVDAPATEFFDDPRDRARRSEAEYRAELLGILPAEERSKPGADLFAEALVCYGIHADPAKRPIEVLANGTERFRFYPGDDTGAFFQPDRVVFVTAGGVKIAHPMDLETEQRLRKIFRTQKINPKTSEIEETPLPENLTLPRTAVTGLPPTTAPHRFEGGYLRRRAMDAARSALRR